MMAEHAEELDDGQQQDQQKQEEWHHKRVGEAWREGLHALAQNLKCPICLGYGMHVCVHLCVSCVSRPPFRKASMN